MPAFVPSDDPLLRDAGTGLPNRRALLGALRERVPTERGALVLIDLDAWRKLADRLVKVQVDRMLSEVAKRFAKAAGEAGTLFRYALDEFALLVPDGDRERGTELAEALRAALARSPVGIGEEKGSTMAAVKLTASAGVAAYPLDGRSPTALLETAEIAVMVAKHTGRNRVAVAGRLDPAALAEIGVFRGLPCPVLVGRVEEQTRLRQLASDVRHVGPCLALVTGSPGFGKTRLLRELALWARTERFVVMSAVGQEHRAAHPYGLLVEMVENLLVTDRGPAAEALGRLTREQRAALSVMIRDFPGGADLEGVEIGDFGLHLAAAWAGLLDELAKIGPLFLAVDEAEHVDGPSLEVLGGALQRRLPVLFAGATSKSALELGGTPVGELLKARSSILTRVALRPLGAEEMGQVLRSILPQADVAPEAAQRLVGAAGGNPLHLEETIRALLLRGRVKLRDGVWTIPALEASELPGDLDGAVRAVAEALPERANSLLARAAVIGLQVDPDLLQEVMGQDENEMLDLIDEARRARLLSSPEWGSELLTFPAAHARKVRLEAAEAGERREIHARVGVVQEARHGGNVSHIADELAFHYGKAGQDVRARHFEVVARRRSALVEPPRTSGSRRTRLEPVKEPLGEEALGHAGAMLRWFGAALRIGRLYPKQSQVSVTFLAQLKQAVQSLFACGTGLTVAVGADGLTLNGVPAGIPAAVEFAQILQDRLIESITWVRTFDPDRLKDVLEAFGESFNAVAAKADHWDLFLDRKSIEGLDILQKAYQSVDRGGGGLVRGDDPVPAAEMPALLTALRALKAATENVKLYPPGHILVEETADQATKTWRDLLSRVPAVTLGTAEGDLVVNGQPADRRYFGDAGGFLVKEVEQRGLWSVSMGRGLTGDEVRSLIGYLSTPAGTALGDRLIAQLPHVAFGSRQYERAAAGDGVVELSAPPKPIRSEIRARELLALPYGDFLKPAVEDAFPVLVETLSLGSRRPLAEQLVERLGEHFHDADIRHRRDAYDLLARSLAFASPSCRQVEVSRSAPPLRRRLLEDALTPQFRAAADILPIWVPAAATSGCLRELSDIVGGALRRRADAEETPPEITLAAEAALQHIPSTAAYPVLLAAVQRTRAEERALAIGTLVGIGGDAVRRVIELVLDDPDPAARQSAALGLSIVADQVGADVVAALGPEAPPERFGRAIDLLDHFQTPALTTHLATLAEAGPPAVRKQIIASAERLPRGLVLAIARKLVGSADAARRQEGIELALRMGVDSVAADLRKLLEAAEDESFMRKLCRYFAALPSGSPVTALARIAAHRPRFFGFVKGYAAETRAEAVRALLRAGGKEAETAVAAALADAKVKDLLKDDLGAVKTP